MHPDRRQQDQIKAQPEATNLYKLWKAIVKPGDPGRLVQRAGMGAHGMGWLDGYHVVTARCEPGGVAPIRRLRPEWLSRAEEAGPASLRAPLRKTAIRTDPRAAEHSVRSEELSASGNMTGSWGWHIVIGKLLKLPSPMLELIKQKQSTRGLSRHGIIQSARIALRSHQRLRTGATFRARAIHR